MTLSAEREPQESSRRMGDGIRLLFPKERCVKRVEDRKVLSGIIPVIQKGLRWMDAPAVYGPHKTLYNRCRPW